MLCVTAGAEEVTFGFRGLVHEMDGEFSYLSGHPFEITLTFETTADDARPEDPAAGSYIGAIKSGTLVVYSGRGDFGWTVKPGGHDTFIEIKNQDTADSFIAAAPVSGRVYNNDISAHFVIEMIDSSAAAFGDDKLPSSLKMPSFDRVSSRLSFIGLTHYTYSTLGVITAVHAPAHHP